MYTRSRQSQNYPNARTNTPPNAGSFQGSNNYQGNYQGQGNNTGNQQGNGQNPQLFKAQQQQQQQSQMQQQQQPNQIQQATPGRNAQQMKQQQPPMPQQQAATATRNVQQTKQQQSPMQQQQQQAQLQQAAAAAARNAQQVKQQQSPMQQQQQQQLQQQQQQQQQMQQSHQATHQPQRLKPILKQTSAIPSAMPMNPSQNTAASNQASTNNKSTSPVTPTQPASGNNNNSDAQNEFQQNEGMDVDVQEQPRWRRKVPGFKVNKRLKRLRLNQRLRKTLQPKNAIMVLNEMKAGVQFTFPETQGPMSNSLYVVHAELDGKTYVGQGLSKPLARQNAAENALKALLLEKMTAASMRARMDAEADGQSVQSNDSIVSMKEENSEDSTQPMETTNVDETDEIPWSSIASFALYKLFLEWHNQGTSVPVPRPGLPSPAKGVKKDAPNAQKAPVQKELPPNATSIHPVMLLNQMRPGLTYVELNRVGNPPNTMFTLAVEVDGVEYTGTAKNKKDAKRIAAKAALLALYDLTYPGEVKMEVPPEMQADVQMA